MGCINSATRPDMLVCRKIAFRRLEEDLARESLFQFRLSGTQIHPSCCSGVFVDQSAESVASVELLWRAWTDEA